MVDQYKKLIRDLGMWNGDEHVATCNSGAVSTESDAVCQSIDAMRVEVLGMNGTISPTVAGGHMLISIPHA